jgi:pimeloyl-ACP methyl ester carboxylesterase
VASSAPRVEIKLRRLKQTFFDPSLVTPDFISEVWEANREADVQSATMSRLRGPSVQKAFISRIAEIQVPTLVMWGMNDPVFPIEVGLKFKERISGSDFVAYEKCGHFPMMERADATAQDFTRFYRETVA